jgi:hypothetical protein
LDDELVELLRGVSALALKRPRGAGRTATAARPPFAALTSLPSDRLSPPAWVPSRNPLTRLTQPPKHHLADPALAARLLGAIPESLLTGKPAERPGKGPLVGNLFESLATLSVRVYAQAAEARVGHLRTFGVEREIDLIVERPDGCVLAIEVKLGGTVDDEDVKHLLWLRRNLGDDVVDAAVVPARIDAPTALR